MTRQKRVVAIHDISCAGRCSLTVALPVLSAAGIETSVIPTAVLSTHTGEFTGYTYRDLSEDMPAIANHWSTLNLHTDAVYTGYLASESQIDTVCDIIDGMRSPDTLVFVDPVMGDGGRLYSKFDKSFPCKMKKLCAKADVIVPNITEASLLLGTEYSASAHTKEEIESVLKRLSDIGPKLVILTGVCIDNKKLGAMYYDARKDTFGYSFSNRVDGFYYGTGDLFASYTLGALLDGIKTSDAVEIAVECTAESILRTKEEGRDTRFGVNFEQGLGDYISALTEKG